MILDRRIRFSRFSIAFLFVASISANCNNNESPLASGAQISLHGRVSVGTYFDANDHIEKQYILILNSGISVSKNEFGGPVKGVTKIQIIPSTDRVFRSTSKLLRKASLSKGRVLAYGKLEYPISDHHHTKVCIELDSLHFE